MTDSTMNFFVKILDIILTITCIVGLSKKGGGLQ